ncbi:unnamed protein product [Chironomus riparius]|uniref:Uncharacterized protein n=1 Tax=Chironomus riparius TaxID=315576 RepID=A0A9N9S6U4_9DIPT|nr:unnamed protein product [Chironomus riparius]
MINQREPVLVEELLHEVEDELCDDDEAEQSRGSKVAAFFQKPFDFIQMMVQFVIYFMVRMATEGCMLPMPELDDDENEEEADEDEDDVGDLGFNDEKKEK